ncbi:unnamed protein product, partial [Meganyctiphanes norvegica]
ESDSQLFHGDEPASDSDIGEDGAEGPPASALTRRRALVPPKLLTDQSSYEELDQDLSHGRTTSNGIVEGSISRHNRRSSIVVIPPMQICPGDLLVYSKVLTQRTNLLHG